MSVKLTSKTKKLLLLQFTGWPYDCSYGPVFLNLIRHANPFSKYTEVRGPPHLHAMANLCIKIPSCGPPDLHDVAHWLRTTGLECAPL